MTQKLPRSLIAGLAILAALSFSVSMYLEWLHFDFLVKHPISVNLISGVVGFSTGGWTIAVIANWFIERDRILLHSKELSDRLLEFKNSLLDVTSTLPAELLPSGWPGDNERWRRELRNMDIGWIAWSTLFEDASRRVDYSPNARQPSSAGIDCEEFRAAAENWCDRVVPHFMVQFGVAYSGRIRRKRSSTSLLISRTAINPHMVLLKLQDLLDAVLRDAIIRRWIATVPGQWALVGVDLRRLKRRPFAVLIAQPARFFQFLSRLIRLYRAKPVPLPPQKE